VTSTLSQAPHTRYYLGFNLTQGIGPTRLQRLIERCGSVQAAWQATSADLLAAGLDARTSAAFLEKRRTLDLEAELEQVRAAGIGLLTIEDASYPRLLARAPNAPPLLYVRGSVQEADNWALAVVGTRSPTSYGKEVTRQLVGELARHGITIVSGMAMGIDSVAHAAALDAGGRSIAVMGCGLDILYPSRNSGLAERMLQQGAIISDYPLGTRPLAANFPPRNRIISGLSLGTLVVEAGEKSGALITVEFALEQGRDVFAVPGPIFNAKSKGTHQLIRNGAGLVSCAADILEELNLMSVPAQQEAAAALPDDPAEAALLAHISAEPRHIDVIARESGLAAAQVSAMLSMLQLKGYVRESDGGCWVLGQ
jgi:DNA processing protein